MTNQLRSIPTEKPNSLNRRIPLPNMLAPLSRDLDRLVSRRHHVGGRAPLAANDAPRLNPPAVMGGAGASPARRSGAAGHDILPDWPVMLSLCGGRGDVESAVASNQHHTRPVRPGVEFAEGGISGRFGQEAPVASPTSGVTDGTPTASDCPGGLSTVARRNAQRCLGETARLASRQTLKTRRAEHGTHSLACEVRVWVWVPAARHASCCCRLITGDYDEDVDSPENEPTRRRTPCFLPTSRSSSCWRCCSPPFFGLAGDQ